MKVIVVEDEPNSLMGMKRAVESIDMDLALFTAKQAEDAVDIINEHRPELIVTDIMLPGMTGLDMVEHFIGEKYQPKVIVVSGYNDFDYARRSIRFGAVDYLLKPFRTEEFVEKIRKSISAIKQERTQTEQYQQQRVFAQIGNKSMRDNYLVDFCMKRTPLEEHIYQRLKLWNLAWIADQSYTIIVIDTKGFPDGKPLGSNFSLQTFAIGNIVNEVLMDYTSTVYFQDPKNRWVVITETQNIRELLHSIADNVRRFQKIELALGVSCRMSVFEEIHDAYHEALKAFRIHSLSDHSDYFFESIPLEPNGYAAPDQISSMICEGDEQLIRQAVHQFIRQIVLLEGTKSREDIIRCGLNYISQIHVSLSERTTKELEEIPMSVWENFDECKTIEDYQDVLFNYLIKLCHQMYTPRTNSLVERAIEIIALKFTEDISLNKVADELMLHPVWLSQLFKRETGKTFTDYLTDLRISRAKALLRDTSMKIYEIAGAVGYNDLQYFGALFKKKVGETPKEFRYGK